jgi:hypothetical protein
LGFFFQPFDPLGPECKFVIADALFDVMLSGCRSTIFARDAAPGDTKGNGVKEIWSLAQP